MMSKKVRVSIRRGRADQNTGFTWQGLYIVRAFAETDALDYVSCARL